MKNKQYHTFKLFGFPIFLIWAYPMKVTLWRLFQKRVVRNTFYIYVFITNI